MIAFGRISRPKEIVNITTVNKTDFDWIIMHLGNDLFTENLCIYLYFCILPSICASLYEGWKAGGCKDNKLDQKEFPISINK